MPRSAILLALLILSPSAMAQPARVELVPAQGRIAIRTYGMGFLPIDGHFTRFSGVLHYDTDHHATCSVALRIDAASLEMAPAPAAAMARGPDFLDVARYRLLSFRGTCGPDGIAGLLTMHGVTRPFVLTPDWDGRQLIATGRLERAAWGMTARPLLGGRTVRITVTLPLPRAVSARRADPVSRADSTSGVSPVSRVVSISGVSSMSRVVSISGVSSMSGIDSKSRADSMRPADPTSRAVPIFRTGTAAGTP